MKKKIAIKLKILSLIFIFTLIGNINYAQDTENLYKKIDLFSEVLEKITLEYVDEVDQSEIMDAAINGALQALDPYSAYMSPELYQEMQTDTEGKFGGLGIEVGMERGLVKVISPIDNTPAFRAGIKAGDFIIKINGDQVQGKTLMEAVNLMRGPIGTDIEITIVRKGFKKPKKYTITRDIIEIRSVISKILEVGLIFIKFIIFFSIINKTTCNTCFFVRGVLY